MYRRGLIAVGMTEVIAGACVNWHLRCRLPPLSDTIVLYEINPGSDREDHWGVGKVIGIKDPRSEKPPQNGAPLLLSLYDIHGVASALDVHFSVDYVDRLDRWGVGSCLPEATLLQSNNQTLP